MSKIIICLSLLTLIILASGPWAASVRGEDVIIDAAPYINAERGDSGIQAAIDAAAEAGGGTVVLPEGEFIINRYLYLRSNVTLRGQGKDTILRHSPLGKGNRITADVANTTEIPVEGSLEGLKPGMVVTLWPNPSRPAGNFRVAEVRDQVVVLTEPFGGRIRIAGGHPYVTWGRVGTLAAPAVKGERTIRVEHPELFASNQGFLIGGEGDQWNIHFNAVENIEGDVLTLHRPLTVNAEAGTEALLDFSAITADGEKNVAIEDLLIEGCQLPYRPLSAGFYLSAVHIVRAENVIVKNVEAHHWNADGFSFQSGSNLHVERCVATNNRGHGFHPGTGWNGGEFIEIIAENNGNCGFYYCWHNKGVNIRRSRFVSNGSHGVGKLGHPGNVNNIVEGNLIERNGNSGIQMNGAGVTRNIIRGNIIRDNSQSQPGQWPGIVLSGMANTHVREVTIEGNTIESTLEASTQWVGIEERVVPRSSHAYTPGSDVNGHYLPDYNRIIGNRISGHKTADIIVRGPNTVVEGNEGVVVEDRFVTNETREE